MAQPASYDLNERLGRLEQSLLSFRTEIQQLRLELSSSHQRPAVVGQVAQRGEARARGDVTDVEQERYAVEHHQQLFAEVVRLRKTLDEIQHIAHDYDSPQTPDERMYVIFKLAYRALNKNRRLAKQKAQA